MCALLYQIILRGWRNCLLRNHRFRIYQCEALRLSTGISISVYLQDTPDEEHDGSETCAVPCEVNPHGAVGDTNLAGPCGCIGPEGNCNEEFAGGFVKDLCNRMGNNPVSALARAGTQMQSPVLRRLQATQQPLQLNAGVE